MNEKKKWTQGQEVLLKWNTFYQNMTQNKIVKIERVTPSGLAEVNGQLYDHRGNPRGVKQKVHQVIEELSPALRERLDKAHLARDISAWALSQENIQSKSLDELKVIHALLKPKEEESGHLSVPVGEKR